MTNDYGKQRVVEIASAILDGEVDMLIGCHEMVRQTGLSAEARSDPDFLTLRGVDSDLDAFPMGPAREHWAPDALAERDKERDAFRSRVSDALLAACAAIIEKWRRNAP